MIILSSSPITMSVFLYSLSIITSVFWIILLVSLFFSQKHDFPYFKKQLPLLEIHFIQAYLIIKSYFSLLIYLKYHHTLIRIFLDQIFEKNLLTFYLQGFLSNLVELFSFLRENLHKFPHMILASLFLQDSSQLIVQNIHSYALTFLISNLHPNILWILNICLFFLI